MNVADCKNAQMEGKQLLLDLADDIENGKAADKRLLSLLEHPSPSRDTKAYWMKQGILNQLNKILA